MQVTQHCTAMVRTAWEEAWRSSSQLSTQCGGALEEAAEQSDSLLETLHACQRLVEYMRKLVSMHKII